jgi:hypothetical protein
MFQQVSLFRKERKLKYLTKLSNWNRICDRNSFVKEHTAIPLSSPFCAATIPLTPASEILPHADCGSFSIPQ